jgi:hypothetical protein
MPKGDPLPGDKTPLTVHERTELQSEEQAQDARRRSSADIDLPPADMASTLAIPEDGGEALGRMSRNGPPYRVPGYQDWVPLGAGTFGEVWRARQESTTVVVAIKFYLCAAAEVDREVRRLAQLAHAPGIIRLEGVCVDVPVPYLVMEHADHGSLAARLEKGPLPVGEAVRIFREAAEALAYVHAKGILHCDLKPGNILLDVRDHVRLADFGQAQLASELMPSLGTFFYMAPEQADPTHPVPDTRWDVYALGAVLHAMLTGEAPHRGEELSRQLHDTVHLDRRLELYRTRLCALPRPAVRGKVRGVDRDLADLIERCLEPEPEKRLADAAAVLAALRRRALRRKQRPLFLVGLVAAVLLLALVVGVTSALGAVAQARAEQELTEQLLDSNQDTARLVAHAMQNNLRSRLRQVGRAANRADLARMVGRRDRQALEAFLDRQLMVRASDGQPTRRFFSAWVTDPKGKILAVRYLSRQKDGEMVVEGMDLAEAHKTNANFSWREWFNGRGNLGDRRNEAHAMVREMHVSDPFYSRIGATTMLAISVPIRGGPAGPGAESVGLLSAGVRFRDLADWLGESTQLSHRGAILVLNHARDGTRCLLLNNGVVPEYPAREGGNPVSYPRHAFPGVEAALAGKKLAHTIYTSPLDRRVYLAGCARTTEQLGDEGVPRPRGGANAVVRARLDWVVMVQHEKSEALAPLEQLRGQLDWLRFVACAGAVVLLAGLWSGLFWVLRRQEGLAGS